MQNRSASTVRTSLLLSAKVLAIASAMLCLTYGGSLSAAKIEAIKGKRYELSKQHGPWMIMVASFRDIESRRIERRDGRLQYVRNERYEEGMSALEAADALVYELRLAGIPAYVAVRQEAVEEAQTADRRGRPRTRKYKSRLDGVAVLAGNYKSFENPVGQQSLRYVKKNMQSRVLSNPEAGAVYRPTPGQANPLSGAFLTLNPMLSAADLRRHVSDPLIKQLNTGIEYSLAENPGKYSLIIASFNGRSMKKVSENSFSRLKLDFNQGVGNSLDDVADMAWQLAKAMRNAKGAGYDTDYEVYVWHDHYRSLVTIGSFDDPKDPRIARYIEMFRAKTRRDPYTGRTGWEAEVFTVPRRPRQNETPRFSFMFDPTPTPMAVPKLN